MKGDFYLNAVSIWHDISKGISKTIDPSEFDSKLINSLFHVGDYYYYILDLAAAEFLHVSPEVQTILGVPSDISEEELLARIHPEDRPYFLKFEELSHQFFSNLNISQILKYKISYDFRMTNADNQYIRILHQVICINHSTKGNPLHALGVHTDITHIKSQGEPKLSFIGLHGEPSFFDQGNSSAIKALSLPEFTKKEIEIIRLVASGLKNSEIATLLFNREHTIKEHRKNMTKKTGLTTNQLIYNAIRQGWI